MTFFGATMRVSFQLMGDHTATCAQTKVVTSVCKTDQGTCGSLAELCGFSLRPDFSQHRLGIQDSNCLLMPSILNSPLKIITVYV